MATNTAPVRLTGLEECATGALCSFCNEHMEHLLKCSCCKRAWWVQQQQGSIGSCAAARPLAPTPHCLSVCNQQTVPPWQHVTAFRKRATVCTCLTQCEISRVLWVCAAFLQCMSGRCYSQSPGCSQTWRQSTSHATQFTRAAESVTATHTILQEAHAHVPGLLQQAPMASACLMGCFEAPPSQPRRGGAQYVPHEHTS